MAEKLSSTQVFEEEWDKKKIAVAVVVLILLIAGFIGVRSYLLPMFGFKEPSSSAVAAKSVKGIETSIQDQNNASGVDSSVSLPTANDVQEKIAQMQDQVTHLSLQEIASSSPQVRQILEQLQALPNVPGNMAKQACINLCNKL